MYIKHSTKSYQKNINLREFSLSGEIIGTYDIEVTLIDGGKIEVPKSEAYKYEGSKKPIHIILDDNVVELTESMISTPIENINLMLFDMSQNKIIAKTDTQLKTEKVMKLQDKVLNSLKIVNVAIATQEATNKILAENGEDEIYDITKEQIKEIGIYQHDVLTFLETWNPDEYTLESITESIFNGGLDIPEILQKYIEA